MSAKKPNQWMPLDINAFRSKTARLSTEEKGAYLLLLMDYWDAQEAIPSDENDLANIAGFSVERWREVAPRVLRFFTESDGKLHNRRIDSEIQKACRISARSVSNGKKGGRPKGSKNKPKINLKETQNKPRGLPRENLDKTQSEPEKNTRACNGGGLRETGQNAVGLVDLDFEKSIQKLEANWNKDPDLVKLRANARARIRQNKFRGIA